MTNIENKLFILKEEAIHSLKENHDAKKKIMFVKNLLSSHLKDTKDSMAVSIGKTSVGIFGKITVEGKTLAFVDGYKNKVSIFKSGINSAVNKNRQSDPAPIERYIEDIKLALEKVGFFTEIN